MQEDCFNIKPILMVRYTYFPDKMQDDCLNIKPILVVRYTISRQNARGLSQYKNHFGDEIHYFPDKMHEDSRYKNHFDGEIHCFPDKMQEDCLNI